MKLMVFGGNSKVLSSVMSSSILFSILIPADKLAARSDLIRSWFQRSGIRAEWEKHRGDASIILDVTGREQRRLNIREWVQLFEQLRATFSLLIGLHGL